MSPDGAGPELVGLEPGGQRVALVDLLDRLLAGGVVLAGELTISLAGVDLVHVSLRALISSVSTLMGETGEPARAVTSEPVQPSRELEGGGR
jgi:hypothetical protein